MAAANLAFIVIRALALWIFVNGVLGLSLVFQQWLDQDFARQTQVVILLASTVLPMATSLVVWASADWLAMRVARGTAAAPGDIRWELQDLTRLCVATVGLVTLVQVLPTLAWQASVATSLLWWRNSALGPMSAPADLQAQYWGVSGKANIVSEVVTALLGLALVLAPARVAALMGTADRRAERHGAPGSDEGVQDGDEVDKA